MQKLIVSVTSFATGIAFISSPAWPQTVGQDTCSILASKLTPDISNQTSAATRFAIYQSIVKDEKYAKIDNARSNSFDLGLSVLDYVDLTIGTKSDDKTWQTNREKFLSMSFSQASATSTFSSSVSRWNPDVISSFVQGCQNPRGFFAQVSGVADDHASFTITVHGIGNWQLQGIHPTPKDPQFTCGNDDSANRAPITKTNIAQIQCEKDPNKSLFVSIDSSLENVGPFRVLSVADDLRAKAEDYSKVTEAKISAISSQVSSLKEEIAQARTEINTLRENVNGEFQKLTSWGQDRSDRYNEATIKGEWGFNTTDPSHGGSCDQGAFVTGIQTGTDSNNVNKIRYRCRMIPALGVGR